MNIKRKDEPIVTGRYKAMVTVGNVIIKLDGQFELPESGSDSSMRLALELAIKSEIEITISRLERDAVAEAAQ